MIPNDIKEKIKYIEELRVENTDKTNYRFDYKTNTLYIPITETDFSYMFSDYNFRKINFCIDNLIEKVEGMFNYCRNLDEIIFTKKLNLSNSTSLNGLFNSCMFLKYFNFKDIITSKKLEKVQHLFSECERLREVTFGDNFYTDNIRSIKCMFYRCKSLEKINSTENKSFENLKYMQGAFMFCENLSRVDLRSVNFNNIKNLHGVFIGTSPNLEILVNSTFTEDLVERATDIVDDYF